MRLDSFFIGGLAAFALSSSIALQAQTVPVSLVGTYDGSQPEVATQLHLAPNGRFEYYLRYGALDETARGSWTADGQAIVLTSDPVKTPAFQLLGTQPGKGSTLEVSLDLPERWLFQLFSVFVLQPDGTIAEIPFQDGDLDIPIRSGTPNKIALGVSLYQVMSQAYPIPPGTRSMQFRFLPNDFGRVAFDHHRLPRVGDAFVLQRFDRTLRYSKQAPAPAPAGAAGE